MSVMTVTSAKVGAPSLDDAARLLGVEVGRLDPAYGVVVVDPVRGVYAVQVDGPPEPDRARFSGPWADPRIDSFGPPRKDG